MQTFKSARVSAWRRRSDRVFDEVAQLASIRNWPETTRKLNLILNNLSRQTNLKFNLDLKPRDVVVIRQQQ